MFIIFIIETGVLAKCLVMCFVFWQGDCLLQKHNSVIVTCQTTDKHVEWDVCSFLFFFLFRVCVKKSTQERLALKILIDRPKARNEVRGNTVVGVINPCCLLSLAISICLPPSACLITVFINSCFSFPFNLCPVSCVLPLSVCMGPLSVTVRQFV